ncbi:amidohydrolase [Mucilaginibacter psychrotolerans]|uniref:Amidohydrolase n=1 Tax=Mucilaginibacter psychrotolerans TaxID=1524096 RepID=A0A4Y8SN72_9SPHI|nr:amidohydrolase [Mucilaginibacter psychrotolerans]TFF40111.1 amidohydrolase [Mucilaginibacter psychrotolerans]
MKKLLLLALTAISLSASAQNAATRKLISTKADALQTKIVAWRRDFHEHPELGNREVRTAGIIAAHLKSLGIEVQTGVATTGVVGVLKGAKPGPVVALRADMDGLPVTERVDLPFASKVKTQYNGNEVGVMHACGHDSHMAILMAVAEILSGIKNDLHGTVKFIFQPAEEGAPFGEAGGAEQMVKEGVMENPHVDVVFGLHINSQTEVGKIVYRTGGIMAGVSDLQIIVKGRSAHGAYPWSSVDPMVVSAQIITGLQSIVSRNVNITENPAVVTIGAITGGTRFNIIAESVKMQGTVRYFTKSDEKMITDNVRRIATKTAEAYGATAEVLLPYSNHYPVTFNDPALTALMLPTLEGTAGKDNVSLRPPVTGAEDFSFYQQKAPGIFFFLGGMPKGSNALIAPSHHTPDFYIDESGFGLGVKALCNLTLEYMAMKK